MWWDLRIGSSCVDLTGDPSVVADAQLRAALESMDWDDLQILDIELRQLETYLNTVPELDSATATAESEAEFVDRPINGEVVLVAPSEDNILLFATALNQQILSSPARWRLDLHENLCNLIEIRLAEQPRTERIKRRLVRHARRWRRLPS